MPNQAVILPLLGCSARRLEDRRRRTQVVKGRVCKTLIHRFESDRRLHFSLHLSRARLSGRSDHIVHILGR